MLHILKHDFRFFAYQNITKFLQKHLFCIAYSDISNKLATFVFSLYFKKQTLEPLLYLSFKAELPTNGLQDNLFLVLKSIQTEKTVARPSGCP